MWSGRSGPVTGAFASVFTPVFTVPGTGARSTPAGWCSLPVWAMRGFLPPPLLPPPPPPPQPRKGQIIATEKPAAFLHHPMASLRQTDEGGIMIGDSQEDCGFDTGVGQSVIA